jgi:hypothetical protein
VRTVTFVREPAQFLRCMPGSNGKKMIQITVAGALVKMEVDVDFIDIVLHLVFLLQISS